ERRVLIAYTVKDRTPGRSAWRRIGVAFPHDRGAGLTDALPIDGRIVLVETKADPASVNLRDPPSKPPRPSSSPSAIRADCMPTDRLSLQPGYHKEFLEIFRSIGRHHGRYERFADFLELATCAIRKITVPPGSEAEAFEERYMKVVARYPPDDIRTMPK